MKTCRIQFTLLISVLLSLSSASGPQETIIAANIDESVEQYEFSESQSQARFFGDFRRWSREDVGSIPADEDAVLFIGSSSIRLWESLSEDMAPRPVIHRGFGGSTMGNVVEFKDFFARYRAKTIVVYEGDNDLKNGDPKKIAEFIENCEVFVNTIHTERPDTEIYFLSPKVSIKRWKHEETYAKARVQLEAFTQNNPRLHYIDIASAMLDEQGEPLEEIFVEDKIHMNAQGYAIWKDIIRDALGLDESELK